MIVNVVSHAGVSWKAASILNGWIDRYATVGWMQSLFHLGTVDDVVGGKSQRKTLSANRIHMG